MKKVFNFFLMSCLLATSMCFMIGCDKKDDYVPDPPGTITANIGNGTTIYLDGNTIGWMTPNNFYLHGFGTNHSQWNISICNLGLMNGLGNITQIPTSGFTRPTNVNGSVACEKG